MKHVSNADKAKELGEKYIGNFFSPKEYSIEHCLLDMAQWKDEQFSIERKQLIEKANQAVTQSFENGAIFKKQQWIEKAVIFLNERVCTEMSIPKIHNMIVDFRKSMGEQL